MNRPLIVFGLFLTLAFPAYGAHSSGSHGRHTSRSIRHSDATRSRGCKTCPRDEHGRIKRDPKARQAFLLRTGYSHGRRGYVVDHIVPLECGGSDSPRNMQWQTKAAAKAKDRTEHACRK